MASLGPVGEASAGTPVVNQDSQAQPEQNVLCGQLTKGCDKVARLKQL